MAYGILGGSFDPVHLGHVHAAEAAVRLRRLARVFLVPAGRAPHKGGGGAPFEHRVAMARLASGARPGLEVLDLEGRRPGPSYTIDTIAELRRLYPGVVLELLVGADMLLDLPSWRRAEEVVGAVQVVGFARPGVDAAAARRAFDMAFGPGRHAWLDLEPLDISSREIRRRLAAAEPVGGLLDPAVEAYIRAHGLYGTAAKQGG